MKSAQSIINAFEMGVPVRISSMKWHEFLEMLNEINKAH
jgi:hypothetical protein